VAAVIARCSGDKPDKEESAGSFQCYGDFVLRLQWSMPGTTILMAFGVAGWLVLAI